MKGQKKICKWGERTYIMGVINLTPDSFSGDGLLAEKNTEKKVLEQAQYFVNNGVDIIDIGAESSRPGSEPLDTGAELERLLPSLQAILKADLDAIVSIDTYKASVAEQALGLGADWINDIWALQKDEALAGVVAEYGAGLVLMHNRSDQKQVKQDDVVGASYSAVDYKNLMMEIRNDLQKCAQTAQDAGVERKNIILDPGIGFGKSVQQNLAILHNLQDLKAMGHPLLIGPSRKSFIGHVLNLPPRERLEGTAATVAIGIANGADIVRVHDIPAMVRVARMTDAIVRS